MNWHSRQLCSSLIYHFSHLQNNNEPRFVNNNKKKVQFREQENHDKV